MSKHKGNVVDPWTVLDKQGADAVRWYFYTSSQPWLPNRFYDEAVNESQRKFMGTLWNTYAFYVLYADIDQFDPTKHTLRPENLTAMDRWVLSRLETTIKTVSDSLDAYKLTEAGRALETFVDELSNWYVRRCRERYWGSEMTDDKEAAYMTLYTVLERMARAIAPFVPFMAEQIYQNIVRTVDQNAPISVHLTDFPEAREQFIDPELEEQMDKVVDIVVLGRAARNAAAIKNRQPLRTMYVQGADVGDMLQAIIKDELNLKNFEFVSDATGFISYKVKPQLRTLGPKYGKLLGAIREHLALDGVGDVVVKTHNEGQNYTFEAGGETVVLGPDDVLVDTAQKEGLVSRAIRISASYSIRT
jgi:isoleucyl-tRNA synthetase